MKRFILWVPLAVFLVFLVTVGIGLYAPSDRTIQSQMVGKPIPSFSLPPMLPGRPGLDSADYASGERVSSMSLPAGASPASPRRRSSRRSPRRAFQSTPWRCGIGLRTWPNSSSAGAIPMSASAPT